MNSPAAARADALVPHWFGGAGGGPVVLLSLFGPRSERAHLRARSASGTSWLADIVIAASGLPAVTGCLGDGPVDGLDGMGHRLIGLVGAVVALRIRPAPKYLFSLSG